MPPIRTFDEFDRQVRSRNESKWEEINVTTIRNRSNSNEESDNESDDSSIHDQNVYSVAARAIMESEQNNVMVSQWAHRGKGFNWSQADRTSQGRWTTEAQRRNRTISDEQRTRWGASVFSRPATGPWIRNTQSTPNLNNNATKPRRRDDEHVEFVENKDIKLQIVGKIPTITKENQEKFTGKCNYCSKIGHKEKDCFKKKRDQEQKHNNSDGANYATGDNEDAVFTASDDIAS